MNNLNLKFLILVSVMLQYLHATPQFARENALSCTACHSSVPMLNDMGKMFLRNGFRLSPYDKTLSQKLKDKNSTIPIGMMLGIGYDSNTKDVKLKAKIFSASPLSDKLSYFISANKNNKNIYLQYNLHEDKHVIRTGILSPFTQFGSFNRLSSNSALKGNNGEDGKYNSSNDKNINKQKGKRSLYISNQSLRQPYQTPLQNSYFRSYKGLEYSYLYNYNTILLISYGKTLDNSTNKKKDTNSNNNPNNDQDPDSADKNQFVCGVSHKFNSGYLLGLMYDKIEESQKADFSTILFIEKEWQKFILNSAYIYKKSKIETLDDYYGLENTIRYKIDDTATLKLIIDIDDENGFNNKGYSLGYNKFFGKVNLNIAFASRENETKKEDITQAFIIMFF